MLIKEHFGNPGGLTRQFPYMKSTFPWKDEDFILTAEALADPDNKYDGLERLAEESHRAGSWQLAGEYWLIAAGWRRNTMDANNEHHQEALQFALRHVEYNRALPSGKRRNSAETPCPILNCSGLLTTDERHFKR